LNAAVLFPAQLHFAEFTLTNGVTENEITKLGIALVAFAMVVSASLPSFLAMFTRRDNGRRHGRIIAILLVAGMVAIPVNGVLSSCNGFC
jgi:hypothetical protein